MSIPVTFHPPIPTGVPDATPHAGVPTGVPVDAAGHSLIPELADRPPTHNEQHLISGEPISMGSTNVAEIWWMWQERRLFVRFLSGDLYSYDGVPLSVAVGMIETDSPGRYVWNKLRDLYPYRRLAKGSGPRARPQVVRLDNR